MADKDRNITNTEAARDARRGATRTPRSIRFSDSEWQKIENAAEERGLVAAEYVRFAALDLAAGDSGTSGTSLTPALVSLIERTYRGVFLLATLKRNEMIADGRADEIDETLEDARMSQSEVSSDD